MVLCPSNFTWTSVKRQMKKVGKSTTVSVSQRDVVDDSCVEKDAQGSVHG